MQHYLHSGENGWVVQIKESLDVLQEEDEDNDKELCVSVFDVPKEFFAEKPEAYIPQSVSITPITTGDPSSILWSATN